MNELCVYIVETCGQRIAAWELKDGYVEICKVFMCARESGARDLCMEFILELDLGLVFNAEVDPESQSLREVFVLFFWMLLYVKLNYLQHETSHIHSITTRSPRTHMRGEEQTCTTAEWTELTAFNTRSHLAIDSVIPILNFPWHIKCHDYQFF